MMLSLSRVRSDYMGRQVLYGLQATRNMPIIKRPAAKLEMQLLGILQAAQDGNVDEVASLLKLGERRRVRGVADVRDKNHMTPFLEAALMGHLEVVKLLLRYKGGEDRLNQTDKRGGTERKRRIGI